VPIHDHLTAVADLAGNPGYAHAVTASGRLAFVSGQVAVDAGGTPVGVDMAAQTRQALGNLHRVLRSLGADWPDVVRFNWYVTDVADIQAVRDVRDELMRPALGDRPNPASSLVRVAGLYLPELLIEVDAVVSVPER
jgi:enamine deaminase RidA (YjgF/YER057c/UK114 family)